MQTSEAAFFNIDNTLMKGASLFHITRRIRRRGAFTLAQAGPRGRRQNWGAQNMDDVHAVRD